MPAQWVKLAVNYLTNPKTRRLSWEAAGALPLLLLYAKSLGRNGGLIPDDDMDPESFGSISNGMPADVAVRVRDELQHVRYLEQTDDGDWRFPSWKKHQFDSTAAERQRRHRAKTGGNGGHGGDRDVTDRNGTNADDGDRTGPDRTTAPPMVPPSDGGEISGKTQKPKRPRKPRKARRPRNLIGPDDPRYWEPHRWEDDDDDPKGAPCDA